jgi:glyoxylase-like metal-dependent hydrolase (beta-lactamase superfamily II)
VTLRGCQAEYLDKPVTPYAVDEQLHESQILPLGDAQWQVIGTSGHTPGHLCLWQPDERPLIAGDSLPDDVGWVSTALDGPDAAATALACRELCLVENRAEPEHLRAGSRSWQSAAQTQIVGVPRALT